MDPSLMPRAAHELRGRHTAATHTEPRTDHLARREWIVQNASDRHFLPNTEFYIQIPRGERNRGRLNHFFFFTSQFKQ